MVSISLSVSTRNNCSTPSLVQFLTFCSHDSFLWLISLFPEWLDEGCDIWHLAWYSRNNWLWVYSVQEFSIFIRLSVYLFITGMCSSKDFEDFPIGPHFKRLFMMSALSVHVSQQWNFFNRVRTVKFLLVRVGFYLPNALGAISILALTS